MNKKKQFAKTTIIIFFGKVCTQLISFFLLPLYTAYLATSEYGLVDLIQTYVTLLVPIITLELEMSIFRYLIDSRGNAKDTKKLISNNFYVLGISLLIFIILYLIFTSFVYIPFRFLILFDIIVCVLSPIIFFKYFEVVVFDRCPVSLMTLSFKNLGYGPFINITSS